MGCKHLNLILNHYRKHRIKVEKNLSVENTVLSL